MFLEGCIAVFSSGWWGVKVLWHINICGLFYAKSIFMQIISSVSNNLV